MRSWKRIIKQIRQIKGLLTMSIAAELFFESGIVPHRLNAVSYGQYRHSASNKTAAGRAKNRKIDIVLVDRNLDLAKKMKENLSTK
jgi:hypothetical protein